MGTIKGFAAHAAGAELLPYKYTVGALEATDIQIEITHCGVCHSDIHLIDNDWGVSQYPFIPGHEIIGTVSAIGSSVRALRVGQRVGVGWQSNSCGVCEWCLKGRENLCAKMEATCVHRNGGYADSVRVNERFAILIPDALTSENAAPLLCGGITVYTPIRMAGVNPSSRVGVIGIGGLGHLALQFAKVFGAEVTAFSTSPNKEEEARVLGAHNFVNTQDSNALKNLAGSFDLLLSTINANLDWAPYIDALRPDGKLWFVGVPPAPIAVNALSLISSNKSIHGSPIGSPSQLREMIDVAARHGVKAITELFPMSKANEAVTRVKVNKVRYRAVLHN